jgi:hypothetical protein
MGPAAGSVLRRPVHLRVSSPEACSAKFRFTAISVHRIYGLMQSQFTAIPVHRNLSSPYLWFNAISVHRNLKYSQEVITIKWILESQFTTVLANILNCGELTLRWTAPSVNWHCGELPYLIEVIFLRWTDMAVNCPCGELGCGELTCGKLPLRWTVFRWIAPAVNWSCGELTLRWTALSDWGVFFAVN